MIEKEKENPTQKELQDLLKKAGEMLNDKIRVA
jgi:hypothetical protein